MGSTDATIWICLRAGLEVRKRTNWLAEVLIRLSIVRESARARHDNYSRLFAVVSTIVLLLVSIIIQFDDELWAALFKLGVVGKYG